MEKTFENFELQIDEKFNKVIIRLNDKEKCVLRICNIPREMVFLGGTKREFIDIRYPNDSSDVKK